MHPGRSHIIISGTGRAGTTLLVQYFTALGLDTGFTLEQALARVDQISYSGLEYSLAHDDLPRILKSPWFADQLGDILAAQSLSIEAAIIPVRSLYAAAESRRRVYHEAAARGFNPLTQLGTIWKTKRPKEQERRLVEQFYKLIEHLVAYQVPIHFLPFPKFARDHAVLFDGLRILLDRFDISRAASEAAYGKVIRDDLIHDFRE